MSYIPNVEDFIVTLNFNERKELLYVTKPVFDHTMKLIGVEHYMPDCTVIDTPPVDEVASIEVDYDAEYLDEAMNMYCARIQKEKQ